MSLNLEYKNKKSGLPDDFYFDNNSDDSQSQSTDRDIQKAQNVFSKHLLK